MIGEGHGGVGHLLRAFGVWLRGPGQSQRHETECSLSAHPLGTEHLLTKQELARGVSPSFGVLKPLEVTRLLGISRPPTCSEVVRRAGAKGCWLGDGHLVTSGWEQSEKDRWEACVPSPTAPQQLRLRAGSLPVLTWPGRWAWCHGLQ